MHPALQRSWLQTGGQPVQPVHHIFRQAFDQVHRVEWLGMGCAKLYDATGVQVGILQLQGPPQVELDHAVEAVLLKEGAGEDATPAPNPAAGDTVIRALDMSDPADRELVRLGGAITGVADRPDLPPVDLPGFVPRGDFTHPDAAGAVELGRRTAKQMRDQARADRRRAWSTWGKWGVIAVAIVDLVLLVFIILRGF